MEVWEVFVLEVGFNARFFMDGLLLMVNKNE